MDESGVTGYWRVRAHYFTSRFLAGTDPGDCVWMTDVVAAPIPLSCVEADEVELLGAATKVEYDKWKADRIRGDAPEPPNEEPDLDAEDANEWGGTLWVARGSMELVVASDGPDEIGPELLELPTVFQPSEFDDGEAEVAEWT